jgi:hypothetical protein
MEVQVTFLDCPEYLHHDGSQRCGLPAEVLARYALGSTDGPLDGVKITCPRGHWFNGSVESLTPPLQPTHQSRGPLPVPYPARPPRRRRPQKGP